MSSRARAVIREVEKRGWEEYRASCAEPLAAARRLWSQSESLVADVAEHSLDGENSLLQRACHRMLAACDRLIASEEEILELNDLSAQTYAFAHAHRDLVWQKYFCDKS
jgi:hypothetical protein